MQKITLVLVILAATFLLFATCVTAAVPHLIRFQGKVTDSTGAPLSGNYNITFRIYNASTGGTLKWSETQSAVPVNNGIFTVLLGNVAPLDLPFDEDYWLSMEVNNDGEMAPRQAITSVGYAYHAEVADSISNVSVVPQGGIIIWRGDTCPTGYTALDDLKDKFLMGKSEYDAEASGGSKIHTHGAGSYAGPSHTHSFSATSSTATNAKPGKGQVDNTYVDENHAHSVSGTTGAEGTGAITGTSASVDSRPEYVTVLFCQKD